MADFDLIAIGGGAGGLAAARAAAVAGKRAALVTDGPIGGDCTWTGCVPSKTLIAAAAQGADFAIAMQRVRETVTHIASTENAAVLESEGVTVLEGRGRLVAPDTVQVGAGRHTAAHVVIATGGAPVVPGIPGLGELDHLTTETIWELDAAPRRLGVLGGGPVGVELAQAMARLGVQVTVFEMADRLLPREEPEASDVVCAALEAEGVRLIVGEAVAAVRAVGGAGGAVLTAGDHAVEVDKVLVAVGRRPATGDLGLEDVGVTLTEQGHIRVDSRLRTSVPTISAVGDVNGLLPFTHAANEQGIIVGRRAAGVRMSWKFDAGRVPWVTFTSPEVARVGVAEAEAPRGAMVAYLPMAENDRAIASGRTQGFIKLIAAPRRVFGMAGGGRIVGATIVAERAGEMIHEPAFAMLTRSFTGRLAQLSHAYPTWSVGIQKAAAQFFQEVEGRRARPAKRS